MTFAGAPGVAPQYASPVDYDAYGQYGPGRGFDRGQGFKRPRYRFQGRITADGSSGFPAEPGRYHLYISWGCPWAQRTAIVRKLMRLDDVVSLSYVDDVRDGRGWAFRESRGADPVNGFADITIDLGGAFGAWADGSVDLYPEPLRAEIDALNAHVYQTVNDGPYRVAGAATEADYEVLRHAMIVALEELDRRLAAHRMLLGGQITEADIRLWPTLARFDAGYNPLAGVSERRLTDFTSLWAYARDLYQRPAFRDTTDFASFAGLTRGPRPSFLNDGPWRVKVEPHLADWDEPSGRERLG